tara:strand:- start:408 stop:1607 length:1200 start_codon:yes stop_codon:yes gene_type:complete
MVAPVITALPTAPDIADPANFATDASVFVAALAPLQSEINAFGTYLNLGENIVGRNLIINGAMQVAQRSTSAAGITGTGYHTCDRIKNILGNNGTYTISQASDGPSGFANSYKMEVTTADAAPAAADFNILYYNIEGFDVQRLKKGTPDAEQVTLSFWVKSNKTGTYQVNLADNGNTRQVGGTYSVSVSGTWEYKTITFPADTSGVLADDNTAALVVEWWLGSGTNYTSGAVPTAWETAVDTDRNAGGTVNIADTIGNTWQITGVQLEVGPAATIFEHRSYGQELASCKRYFRRFGDGSNRGQMGSGGFANLTQAQVVIPFDPELRVVPTITVTAAGNLLDFGAALLPITAVSVLSDSRPECVILLLTTAGISPAAQGDACTVTGGGGANMDYRFDAEL